MTESNTKVLRLSNVIMMSFLKIFFFKDEFEKQMTYLYENGYNTLTIQQVIDYYYNKPIPEKSVLLTLMMLTNRYCLMLIRFSKVSFSCGLFRSTGLTFDEAQEYAKNTPFACQRMNS